MEKHSINIYDEGLILFDPVLVKSIIPSLKENDYLLETFLTTNYGDLILTAGAIVPILNIDVGNYSIYLRQNNEKSELKNSTIFVTNENYYLNVKSSLFLSDLCQLKEWSNDQGLIKTKIAKGKYSVAINGFKQKESLGYEFVFTSIDKEISVTASTGLNMSYDNE